MPRKRIRTPDGSSTLTEELSRRGFLAAALAGAGALGASASPSSAAANAQAAPLVRSDGRYATVPLAKETIRLGVMQTRVRPVDARNPAPGRQQNLDHMLGLITNTQEWNPPSDILFFHEFPITGFSYDWTRRDINRLAIETPGPETEAIGALARKYQCYVVFGSYVNDKDWPGHIISQTTIIGPEGTIVDKHWKARNIMGVFQIGRSAVELMTSTVYGCLDRYIELYGIDHVIPVTRTPVGNLCTTPVQREPELFRAMALKGAEIFLRTATGGFSPWDIQASAAYNQVYAAVCNNALSPGNAFFEDINTGGSAIYGPRGETLAMATSEHEQLVAAQIPIAAFRERHRLPEFAWPMYEAVFAQYRPKFPPSKLSRELPETLQDAARYLRDPANTNW